MSDNNFERHCASDLSTLLHKLLLNFNRPMEKLFCQGPKFSIGWRHFERAETWLKMDLAAEGKNWWKCRQNSKTLCVFTVRWWSKLSGNSWIWLTQPFIRYWTNELGVRKICSKMAPKNFSQNQKDNRSETYLDFLGWTENDSFSWTCRPGNETIEPGMIHYVLIKTKSQNGQMEDKKRADLLFWLPGDHP